MGKGTDKLYITHSEWASEDAYSASSGSGTAKPKAPGSSFKRLPFNFCSVSLQPFTHPVCTANGTIFDLSNILPWLEKHGTNPVTGTPLKSSELIKLHFAKNDEGEMIDPVTFKVFTDNTHILALKNTGNVFAYDTVERLNIKAKMWRDLVNDEEFSRKDLITLQDPQNIESRDLSSFKYLQEGTSTLTPEQEAERNDPSHNLNKNALGNAAKILKAKEAVAKARSQRTGHTNGNHTITTSTTISTSKPGAPSSKSSSHATKPVPYNAAQHTTGQAAASFTSTGLTPHTSSERALLTNEEYLLKPRRVKQKGYARIQTSLGSLNIQLHPEFAPRAVWNFVHLAKKGYYKDVLFHRNIRNFMVQGGDPTGTGKGGASIWNKNFADEFDGPLSHDKRGVVSMANKGKDTNGSQFFITYRAAKHLDRKHTIFGTVVGGLDTLARMEEAEVSEGEKRPVVDMVIGEVVVFVDPFEEFWRERGEKEAKEKEEGIVGEEGKVSWTGRRVDGEGGMGKGGDEGVGKYLRGVTRDEGEGDRSVIAKWEGESAEEPVRKKIKVGGFGNFEGW